MTYLETGADLSSSEESATPPSGVSARVVRGEFNGDNRAAHLGYTIEHGLSERYVVLQLFRTIAGVTTPIAAPWAPVDSDETPSDDRLTFFFGEQFDSAVRFNWVVIG